MTDLADESGDRLAVVLSGDTPQCLSGKFLSGRMIDDGTGKAQAEEVLNSLDEWKAKKNVCAMCFDTTASNTGWERGAAPLIENGLKKALLWLPCRHHISELFLKSSWETVFGIDKSPYYQKFKDFKGNWNNFEKTKFDVLKIEPWMQPRVLEVVQFCQNTLNSEKQPRDDYKECIELVLVTLGYPPSNFSFKKPGALHKARFMAILIYSLKICLFRKVLKLPRAEQKKLERFAAFACLYYIKYWVMAPLASEAPFADLTLYKDMLDYHDHDAPIAAAVLAKLRNHTWFFNQEYVAFNLFSNQVSDQIKMKIVDKLLIAKPPKKYKWGFPSVVKLPITKDQGMQVCVSDFVGNGSFFMFDRMGFDKEWLRKPISTWRNDPSFCEMERYVKTLLICNDAAERGIKLVSDFIDCLTKDSSDREDLLQVVEAHRKQFPNVNKSTLNNAFLV